ncbi:hypothetical protein PHYPSEUDO_006087 [Phytophthora pseudosyringae]|uniref:Uncharacterized protein n=1 Tax=Phytophthora pseudosyringae TaxID=221518 RepID=A0A8T1VJK7_9STRA|nr:hypothetical protein PHYPSEUDO_006087 [Phytophthora pseudosyringae]
MPTVDCQLGAASGWGSRPIPDLSAIEAMEWLRNLTGLYNVKHRKSGAATCNMTVWGGRSSIIAAIAHFAFHLQARTSEHPDPEPRTMKFTVFLATFLAIASAGDPQNAIQLSASAQADDFLATPAPTPAPTTFADLPTPAPTNSSDPTPAPTYPTAAPTESATTDSEDATQSEERSSASTVGAVGVAYSSEGTVGVAYATTRAEYEAGSSGVSSSSSNATVPIVLVGCLVGVLGMVAAVVIARKRKAAAEKGEADYSNDIRTPAPVKAEDAYASAIRTPAAGEAGEVDYSDAIHTPVASV